MAATTTTSSSSPSSPVPIQGAKLNGHGAGASLEPNGHASPQLSSSQDRDEDGLGPMEVNGAGGGGLGARRPSQHARAKSDVFGDALDLAEPNNRLGSSPDVQSAKRVEYEQQLEAQKRFFEQQMQELIEKQAREANEFLTKNNIALPTSTPIARGPSASMPASPPSGTPSDSGSVEEDGKPKKGAPARSKSGDDLPGFGRGGRFGKNRLSALNGGGFTSRDAHSVPTTRRHSGDNTLADTVAAVGALDINRQASKDGDGPLLTSFLFDDELEADLNSTTFASKYLHHNVDDDKFPILVSRKDYPGVVRQRGPVDTADWQLSASSAALDLAPLSQTPPKGSRMHDAARGSEWPQFSEPPKNLAGLGPEYGNGKISPASPGAGLDRAGSPTVSRTLPAPSSPTVELNGGQREQRAGMPQSPDGAPMLQRMGSGDMANMAALNGQFASGPSDPYRGYDLAGNGMYQMLPGRAMNAGLIEPQNRFAGLRLEDLVGDMQNLCRDQHGCRFLQRKLEEGDPHHRDLIFIEIAPIFALLVVDPFANYRMLECATDEQRDRLVEAVSSDIGGIAVNMHGTRAIQKMIDYLSTQYQVATVIAALSTNVIGLIKDLNGNHVVQKCLNHFTPDDCQFIYNAVTGNLVEVATHRHGCCVLQRAIDHASEPQRIQLVTEITYQSLALVQDAFGNYVVQYILDIDPRFADAVVRQFLGNVPALSCQKFSSNVVEKCIRVSDPASRKLLVEELLERTRLERLLNDAFGNYVLQTALDFAEGVQRQTLVTFLRPMLPSIRNTPHGKRLTQKIQRDARMDNMRAGAFHPGGPGQYAPMGGQFGAAYGAPQGMSPFGAPAGGPPQFGQSRGFSAPGGMGPPGGRGMPPPQAYAPYGQQDYGAAFYGGNSIQAGAYAPPFAAFH